MATPKSRLGRGLGALITSGTAMPKAAASAPTSVPAAAGPDAPAPGGLTGYREVAVHLVSHAYRQGPTAGDFAASVLAVLRRLDGHFTLVFANADDPGTIVAARRSTPLVIGIGDGEMFVGSDVAAFIPHTRNAIELGQDQAVVLTADGYRITDFDGNDDLGPGAYREFHIDWDLAAAEKGGYEYFMLKEIAEQPAAVADTSTRFSTRVAFAEGCTEPRNEIVPLTSLATVVAAVVAALAVFADAGASVPVCGDGAGALQPARASAVIDISDKTVLRMGKPHQRESKHEIVQTPWRHDSTRGKFQA